MLFKIKSSYNERNLTVAEAESAATVRAVRAPEHCEVASEGVHGMPPGLLLRLAVPPGELDRAQGVLQGAAEGGGHMQ